ncbi:DUF930 domain-containing protein [Mesorhizobium huakuii]|uniref:DUF930 domain-containing protein n=1 Tax=Mesorhizobium huakuii TaxID=28104 RepID=A0A7G6T376_9HYPH|nr:DUF930 domain-containing protein [Mesorhizobium huakuii]QND61208.1 DUF930 domain-containing protein [Mesorhizobium huakuii]
MKDEARERRRYLLWGIPASLILHVLVAALLIYGLPIPPQQPQEEQPVNVALVPPPDQSKPKPASAPPPKPPEPKVEKPPEQKVEKPPPSEKQAQKPSPVEVLKPVFQFGDKDTGPRKSLDGASAQDRSPSPAKDDASKPPVVPKPADSQPVTPADSEQQAASSAEMDKQQAAKQEADKQAALDAAKQQGEAPAPLAADGGDGEIELPMSAVTPQPKPTNAPKPSPSKASKSASRNGSGFPGVRKLYSQGATGDALATTAMDAVPRGQRAAILCANALQQQLLDASYFPKWVPSVSLKAGNIVDGSDVAFSTTTTWYHLSFRCEVDTDATRVLSLDFRVGAEIPRSEWPRPL